MFRLLKLSSFSPVYWRWGFISILICVSITTCAVKYVYKKPAPETWEAHMVAGEMALSSYSLHMAIRHYGAALTEAKKFGRNDPRLAETLVLNAKCAFMELTDAFQYHEMVVPTWYKQNLLYLPTPESPWKAFASTNHRYSITLRQRIQNYKQIRARNRRDALIAPYLKQAIRIYEKNDGNDSREIALLHLQLAEYQCLMLVNYDQGSFDEIDRMVKRALIIIEDSPLKVTPALQVTRRRLSDFYRLNGDMASAKRVELCLQAPF